MTKLKKFYGECSASHSFFETYETQFNNCKECALWSCSRKIFYASTKPLDECKVLFVLPSPGQDTLTAETVPTDRLSWAMHMLFAMVSTIAKTGYVITYGTVCTPMKPDGVVQLPMIEQVTKCGKHIYELRREMVRRRDRAVVVGVGGIVHQGLRDYGTDHYYFRDYKQLVNNDGTLNGDVLHNNVEGIINYLGM